MEDDLQPLEDKLQTTEDELQTKEDDIDITKDDQNLLFPCNEQGRAESIFKNVPKQLRIMKEDDT